MEMQQIKEEYNGEEVVRQLRLLFKNLGVEKPCEETLRSIRELIEKDGNNKISYGELSKVIEKAVENLQESQGGFK